MWQPKPYWILIATWSYSCSATHGGASLVQPVVANIQKPSDEPNVRDLFMRAYSDDDLSAVRIENAELDPSTPLNPPDGVSAYGRALVEKHSGNQMQIFVRTEDVRFWLWVKSVSVARFVARPIEMFVPVAGPEPSGHVTLGAGASVEVIEDRGQTLHVRYLGGVELDTTLPANALTMSATLSYAGDFLSNPVLVRRGALIYQQPDQTSQVLAKVSSAWQLSIIRELDNGWIEVNYHTTTVDVVGYYSAQMPPGLVTSTWTGQVPTVAANSGDTELLPFTCLYSSVNGAIAGIVDKTMSTTVDASSDPQWKLATVETPWGRIRFALHAANPKTGRRWASCDE
jgi:hypothetical protein